DEDQGTRCLAYSIRNRTRRAFQAFGLPDPIEAEHADPGREEIPLEQHVHDPAPVFALEQHPGQLGATLPVRARDSRVTAAERRFFAVAEQPTHAWVDSVVER